MSVSESVSEWMNVCTRRIDRRHPFLIHLLPMTPPSLARRCVGCVRPELKEIIEMIKASEAAVTDADSNLKRYLYLQNGKKVHRVFASPCMYARVPIPTHSQANNHTHMYTHAHACMHACPSVHNDMRTHTDTYASVYTRALANTNIPTRT
eukprot:GHVU01108312.1.p1 GENE.GHVU01108312.1~~GHVU01108312.1.p1  ORF type:complete len:151 (+),score=1.16 GHVU01108312.1:210-662(+)